MVLFALLLVPPSLPHVACSLFGEGAEDEALGV